MGNKILKMLWFSAFVCGDAFSMEYDICVRNCSSHDVVLSKTIMKSSSLDIKVVDLLDWWKKPDPFEELTIKKNDYAIIRVDGNMRCDNVEGFDSVNLKTGKVPEALCEFKPNDGSLLNYPALPSKDEKTDVFRAWRIHELKDGRVCTLEQDRRGSGFTLTIRGTPNNSMVESNSSISSQGSQ